MVQVFCDVCGKKLEQDCSDQVNLNFNSYGVTGFKMMEVNLCVPCAKLVVSEIEELKKKIKTWKVKDGE